MIVFSKKLPSFKYKQKILSQSTEKFHQFLSIQNSKIDKIKYLRSRLMTQYCDPHLKIDIYDLIEQNIRLEELYSDHYPKQSLIETLNDLIQHIKKQSATHQQSIECLNDDISRLAEEKRQNQNYIENLMKQLEDFKILYEEKIERNKKQMEDISLSELQIKSYAEDLSCLLYEQRGNKERIVQLEKQLKIKQQIIVVNKIEMDNLFKRYQDSEELCTNLKSTLKCLETEIIDASLKIEQLETQNFKLQGQRLSLLEQIEQSRFVNERMKIKSCLSDFSEGEHKDYEDDRMKMKEIAENYKHDQVKISNNTFRSKKSNPDSSEKLDSVSIHLKDPFRVYSSVKKQQGAESQEARKHISRKKYATQLKLASENFLINEETPRPFNEVRKRNKTEIKLQNSKQQNYLFLKKEILKKDQQILDAKAEMQELQKLLEARDEKITDLEGTLEIQEDKNSEELVEFKNQISIQKKLIDRFKEEIAKLKLQKCEEKSKLLTENSKIKAQLSQERKKRQESSVIFEEYEQLLEERKQKLKEKEQEVELLSKDKLDLVRANSQEHKYSKLSTQKVEGIHYICFRKERQIQTEFSEQHQTTKTEQCISSFQQQLQKKSERITELEATLEIQKDKKNQELAGLENGISIKKQIITKLQEEITKLLRENADIKDQLLQEIKKRQEISVVLVEYEYLLEEKKNILEEKEQEVKLLSQEKLDLIRVHSHEHKHSRLSTQAIEGTHYKCYTEDRQIQTETLEQPVISSFNIPVSNERFRDTLTLEQEIQDNIVQEVFMPDEPNSINLRRQAEEKQNEKKWLELIGANRYSRAYDYDRLPWDDQSSIMNQFRNEEIFKENFDIINIDRSSTSLLSTIKNMDYQHASFIKTIHKYKNQSHFKAQILKLPIFDSKKPQLRPIDHIPSKNTNKPVYLIQCREKKDPFLDYILLWNQGLVSLKHEKGIFMKKNQQKIISDRSDFILGNCEIMVDRKTVKIRRKNKKKYFFGDLEDRDWQIECIMAWQ